MPLVSRRGAKPIVQATRQRVRISFNVYLADVETKMTYTMQGTELKY
jgi:hypothetical protein